LRKAFFSLQATNNMLYRYWAPVFFLFVGLFISPGINAQETGLGSWNIFNIKYNHREEMSLFVEGQIRSLSFYNDFHYYEYKGGVNYKLNKSVQFSLGAGSYQTYREGGDFKLPKNNDEFRLWPQLILFQSVGSLKIEQRYRAELRWTSNGYRNRFRYRLSASYPFGNTSKGYNRFLASVSNELFFTDKEPYFERNRLQLNLNYKLSEYTTLQLGYLQQFDYRINDETGRDFLVIGFYHELFYRKPARRENIHELKDN
jgi:hypothetical protein